MNTILSQTRKIPNILGKLRNVFIPVSKISKELGQTGIQVLEYLSNQLQANLMIEEDARNKTKGSLEQGLPLPTQGVLSLHEIFDLVLTSNGLGYRLENRTLRVFLQEEAAKSNLQAEIYDVSDLITMAAEEQFEYFAQEPTWEPSEKYQVFGLNLDEIVENSPELYYTESTLAQLITEKVLKNRWQNFPMALVSSCPGKLFLSHLPQVHQEIHLFLDNLRQLSKIQMNLEAKFITCKTNFFKQVKLEFAPLYAESEKGNSMLLAAQLTPEQEQALFVALATTKDATVCFQKPLTMHHLETRYIRHAYRTHFVAGYHHEPGGEDALGRMYEGTLIKVRPQLYPESQEIALDLEIDVAAIVKPLPTLPVFEGEIALPSQLTQHMQASVRFPNKCSMLIAGFANPYEDEGERSFAPARKKEHLLLYWKADWKI